MQSCSPTRLSLFLLLVFFVPPARAESPVIRQPEFLEQFAATYRFSLGRPANIEITRAGDAVLFLRSGPRSFVRDLYEYDVQTGNERVLVTAERLLAGGAEQLSEEEKARRERMRLAARGIASYELSRDGTRILVPLSGRLFVVERATGATRELRSKAGAAIDARFSPDGQQVACVRDGDLFVSDVISGEERRLTTGATEALTHGLAEFVAQEEMGRMHGYWWSPDGRSLLYQETDTSDVETLYIADPAHPERPAQSWRYPRPGKKNAAVRLGLISIEGGDTRWIAWDRQEFPYLAAVIWSDQAPPTVLVQNREQTTEVLLAVDPESGRTRELLRESDGAWLNLDVTMPRWLPSGEEFLWSSERSGHWQLELRQRDGSLLRTLVDATTNYRRLLGIDEQGNSLLVAAGEDPTQCHVFRIALPAANENDSRPADEKRLTTQPGLHSAVVAEASGAYVLTTQSLDADPRFTIYDRSGKLRGELKSAAETTPLPPRVTLSTVGSDPGFHAAVVRPADFVVGRKYPVIVSVYGGPHSQMVIASRGKYLLDQWLAEQGFLVVSFDGRGTPSRGRAWERAIKGNLIDIPLADQVAALRALAAQCPEIDLNRVGIYGWSFGGYFSAMAALREPEVFHAAVAGAPVTDWLDYDTHYTERYLGLPARNTPGYEASSVLTYAKDLRRPLLVIHGTADDNVYFLHSIRLADALFRARCDFDFLPLSGLTHMVPEPLVTRALYTRIAKFFLDRLATAK